MDAAAIEGFCGEIDQAAARLRRQMRLKLQSQLQPLVGRSVDQASTAKLLADAIHRLLDGQGLRVRCVECGHPSILRTSARGRQNRAVFVFDHTIDGHRTFHGGGHQVPVLKLVAKPDRRRQGSRSEQAGP